MERSNSKTKLFDFLYFPASFGALPLSRDINKQQWRMMTSTSYDANDNNVKNGDDVGVKIMIPYSNTPRLYSQW